VTSIAPRRPGPGGLVARFFRDRRAASAVEFALVAAPFFYLLLGVTQVGIFYMTQSALDTGVVKTAETLRTNFTTGTTATSLGASALKSNVVAGAGGMLSTATVSVELRQLTSLTSASVAIADGTVDYGSTTSTLVLRAQASVLTLAPGLGGLSTIYSSSLIRRQGT
jgi:Flp pilus assembly protein TadG